MGVSRNNSRLFLVMVLGVFLASGCSGHSVKFGANSEGDGMASEGEMTGSVDGVSSGTARHADGTPIHGGTVHDTNPYLESGQGASTSSGGMNAEMAAVDGTSSISGSGADYGRQFGGVDGSGPNHGGVTGFGSGSANASNILLV